MEKQDKSEVPDQEKGPSLDSAEVQHPPEGNPEITGEPVTNAGGLIDGTERDHATPQAVQGTMLEPATTEVEDTGVGGLAISTERDQATTQVVQETMPATTEVEDTGVGTEVDLSVPQVLEEGTMTEHETSTERTGVIDLDTKADQPGPHEIHEEKDTTLESEFDKVLGTEDDYKLVEKLDEEGVCEDSAQATLGESEAMTMETVMGDENKEEMEEKRQIKMTYSEALMQIDFSHNIEEVDSELFKEDYYQIDRGLKRRTTKIQKIMMALLSDNSSDWPYLKSPEANSSVIVKVTLLPSEQMVRVKTLLGQSIKKLKEYFAAKLQMKPKQLRITYFDLNLKDVMVLGFLEKEEDDSIFLHLESVDPVNIPLKPYTGTLYFDDPQNILSVNYCGADGVIRTITVEIERFHDRKPFLGGFRHKINGTEFHNASAQTMRKRRPWPKMMKYTRSTQTCELQNRVMQTPQHTSTQMTKIGCYVSVKDNKLITPKKYFSATEKENLILEKVLVLQTYFRQYMAKKRVDLLKIKRDRRRQFEKLQYQKRKEEKEKRIKDEFLRRMNPVVNEDFETLYEALEKWRLEEIARINSTLTGAERKAALYMLLNEEIEHLAAIGRHKIESDVENRKNNIQNFLNKTAAPKIITSKVDNAPTVIETPYTLRAKELRDIYNSIIMKHLTQDERLDILLTVKHTVMEHDCKLSQEILMLINREADLLVRGVSNENLEGLRKRIATLFLQFTKTPIFNPEAGKFIRVPPDPLLLKGKIYFCVSCNSYLQSTQFPTNVNARNPGSCKHCKRKDNEARYRTDFNCYRHILKVLRLSEEQYNDNSTVAFILQEMDIRYIVEKIWDGQSIISNSNDIYDLALVRWDSEIPWSPWNCLLVTIVEAENHGKLLDIYKGYEEVFIAKVRHKHELARNYFSRLGGTSEMLRRHKVPPLRQRVK